MKFIGMGFVIGAALFPSLAGASRVKDLVSIKGVRDNQLIGYGLVVGLKGTGDSKREYTGMSMSQMLRQLGVDVKADQIESKNVAAVIVTANLPPFARAGAKIDVTVNSIGDAKSLQGGTLLMTPMRGADKNVYVVAQGAMSVGGGEAAGGSSSKAHTTVALIPDGGIVEREIASDFGAKNAIRLALHNPDFTTSARISKTINQELGGIYAKARDSSTVDVIVPYDFDGGVVELIAAIERLPIEQDTRARVIINERTGTIVMGNAVRISSVAISHGSLTLEIKNKETPKEAPAGANPTTVSLRTPASEDGGVNKSSSGVKEPVVSVNEAGDKLLAMNEGATLGDVVKALNALGVTPRDLVGILQSLKAQGALEAELELL